MTTQPTPMTSNVREIFSWLLRMIFHFWLGLTLPFCVTFHPTIEADYLPIISSAAKLVLVPSSMILIIVHNGAFSRLPSLQCLP